MPVGQMSGGQMPGGKMSGGQIPGGEMSGGQMPFHTLAMLSSFLQRTHKLGNVSYLVFPKNTKKNIFFTEHMYMYNK